METCSVDGCRRPVFVKSRGWCKTHYHRWYRTGDPLAVKYPRASGSPIERWWAKVEKTETCWLWIGGKDRHGYGQFDVAIDGEHKNHRAHRWGYEQLVRPLRSDEPLDHLCRVHACVNPAHLEPVTHAENVARGDAGLWQAAKTHCAQGHPFSDENTVHDGRGRVCIACSKAWSRASTRKSRGTPPDAVHNGEKTHCKHGHEFTPENTRQPARGGRVCIECARIATRESQRRRRARQAKGD